MDRPEAFIEMVRTVVEMRELRDRARKVLPEAQLNRFFEDRIASDVATIANEAKAYNEAAAKGEADALEKHRKEHLAKKGAA